MKFRSNRCVAIHLQDLKKAEVFYGGVLGFKLREKSRTQLCYDTGHFFLYINKSTKTQPPIPSFTVRDLRAAKAHLKKHGGKITKDWGGAFYFKDPFGLTYDVVGR